MEKSYARSAQSQLLPWLRALATLILFTAFSWQAEAQSCCQVNIPSASVQNGCVVLNNPPSGACGDQVEWMWAENVNGSIQGRTGFSTNQSTEWCPDYAGDFRICVRVVGCNQVYESGDTHVNPGECSGGVTAIKIMDAATGQPAAGIPVLGDGVSFSYASLPASYYLEVFTNGNSQSAQITVNGVSNTENTIPYNSWATLAPGNNTMVIALYGQDNLGGQQCDHVTINFQAEDDSCVTLTNGSSPYGTNDFCLYEIIRTWTAIDNCGNVTEGVQTITVTVEGTQQVNLFSFPNPFNDRFHVEFQVPRGAEVVACVLDMTGRNVLDIHKGQVDAQRLYQFDFAGLDWPAGSYIIMLQVDDEVFHHKLIVTQNQ